MRSLNSISHIVIHCSDSDVSAHDDISVIDQWHAERGFNFTGGKLKHVGYHFFIRSDGEIQYGRPLEVVGAHVAGYNNNSIGICLHGKKPDKKAQFEALASLIHSLKFVLNAKNINVVGHCDLDPINKSYCPGFNLKKFSDEYLN